MVKVSPLDEMPVSRSSVPNFSPLLPRPWRRMRVCVWVDVGWTTKGSGWFAGDAAGLDIAGSGDYFSVAVILRRREYRRKSIPSQNIERMILPDGGRYERRDASCFNIRTTNKPANQQPTPGSRLQAPVSLLDHVKTPQVCMKVVQLEIIHEVVIYLIIYLKTFINRAIFNM